MKLIKRAERYGFLRRPCEVCGQQMVVARSSKQCINCGHENAAPKDGVCVTGGESRIRTHGGHYASQV